MNIYIYVYKLKHVTAIQFCFVVFEIKINISIIKNIINNCCVFHFFVLPL